jgi:hypothetical protein
VSNDAVVFNGLVQNTDLTSSLTLSTLKASGWIDSVNDVSTNITVPSINSLIINGAMQPDLSITGGAVYGLGSARISGSVNGGFWRVTGSSHGVNLGSVTSGWGGVSLTGACPPTSRLGQSEPSACAATSPVTSTPAPHGPSPLPAPSAARSSPSPA